jgi:hypothetical protein
LTRRADDQKRSDRCGSSKHSPRQNGIQHSFGHDFPLPTETLPF